MADKRFSVDVELKRLTDEGSVEAAFSTSTIVDSDGDRVLSSAFKDGQHVGMVWSHSWDRIVGRGTVRVEPTRAVFVGKFFTDTAAGADAYRTVKAMSAPPSIMGWSFGFRTLDAERGPSGENVIKQVELFEVSPTLIGANRAAATLAIKAAAPAVGSRPGHRPDPRVVAIFESVRRQQEADKAAERAGLLALKARWDAQHAQEKAKAAEIFASVARTLARAERVLGSTHPTRRYPR
jgi:HK97 family phage prohead protease